MGSSGGICRNGKEKRERAATRPDLGTMSVGVRTEPYRGAQTRQSSPGGGQSAKAHPDSMQLAVLSGSGATAIRGQRTTSGQPMGPGDGRRTVFSCKGCGRVA